MNNISDGSVVIGKVLGYSKGWNLLSRDSSVVVKVDNKKIVANIDSRQQKFIQKEYPRGSRIAMGFYGGQWHVGSKPSIEDQFQVEAGVSFMDVLNTIKKTDTC